MNLKEKFNAWWIKADFEDIVLSTLLFMLLGTLGFILIVLLLSIACKLILWGIK